MLFAFKFQEVPCELPAILILEKLIWPAVYVALTWKMFHFVLHEWMSWKSLRSGFRLQSLGLHHPFLSTWSWTCHFLIPNTGKIMYTTHMMILMPERQKRPMLRTLWTTAEACQSGVMEYNPQPRPRPAELEGQGTPCALETRMEQP